MVNPVKAFTRATGLSKVTEGEQAMNNEAVRQAGLAGQGQTVNPSAPPPQPAPLVGQEAAPQRQGKKTRQFAPAIIGSGASADSGSGGKTLLGQ